MAVNKKSLANLVPQNKRSPEERRAIAQKGGKAYAEKCKEKKAMKETVKLVLGLKTPDAVKKQLKKMGIKEPDQINQTAVAVSMLNEAMKGDVRAAEFLRDTSGELPGAATSENNDGSVQIIDDL